MIIEPTRRSPLGAAIMTVSDPLAARP